WWRWRDGLVKPLIEARATSGLSFAAGGIHQTVDKPCYTITVTSALQIIMHSRLRSIELARSGLHALGPGPITDHEGGPSNDDRSGQPSHRHGFLPRGCGLSDGWVQVISRSTEGYADRTASYKPALFDAC